MRKRVKLAFAVLLTALIGLAGWELLRKREPEPVYQGKGLRTWLKEHDHWPREEVARHAIGSIGTNAIPTLLSMVREKDSTTHSKLMRLWQRRVTSINWLPLWLRYPGFIRNSAWVHNEEAVGGFEVLGGRAQPAVPALIEVFEQKISVYSQSAATRALLAIGPAASNAVPVFVKAATNADAATRQNAVMALQDRGLAIESRLAVPALVRALADSNHFVRVAAVLGLGHRGEDAREAVPALVPLLQDTNGSVRSSVRWALAQIDPAAAAQAGVRTNAP